MSLQYSVLMSVYYKEKPAYLKVAIQSMIDQSLQPEEFIIVKDGPLSVELEEVINSYVTKYPSLFTILANKTNLGLGPSLRKGVEKARNEFVARMDSDDYSIPDRCKKQIEIFEKDTDLGMVGSYEAEFIDSIDNIVCVHKKPKQNKEIKKYMRQRCAVLHPTAIFKKSEVIRAGNYQITSVYPLFEDYDLFARMIFDANVKCYNVQEPLYYIRTGLDFYERRGGIKYAKTALQFKWNLYKKRNISFTDFLICGFGQAFICVLPNKMRKLFYLKVLRRKT